jgi:microcin C transport system substrate-binding protein
MITALELTRRETLLLGAATLASTIARPALASEGPERHGMSAFGDLKYPAGFKHFDYVNPNAPKGGVFSHVGSNRVFNQNFLTFNSLNIFILKGDGAQGMELTFASLMARAADEPDALYGLAARAVRISADGLTYRFLMRPGITFHDGSPLTAHDVAFSLKSLKEKGHPIAQQLLRDVVDAEASDDATVLVRFAPHRARDVPLFVASLPIFSRAYYSKHPFDETTLKAPLGSGPYQVGRFETGRFIEYDRVKNWWGADLPVGRGLNNFDVIRYEFYRDRDVAFEGFTSKTYLFREEFTSRIWATRYDFPAIRDGRVKRDVIPDDTPSGAQGWFFNTRREKFKDRRLREAFIYAFDFGEPFVPPVSDGSGQDRPMLRHASALLQEAGLVVKDGKRVTPQGEQISVEFLIDEPSFQPHHMPFIKNLGTLGIEANLRIVDPVQYRKRVDEFDFDLTVQRFGFSNTPGDSLRSFFSSQASAMRGSQNLAGMADPVIDALIEKIIAADNRASLTHACRALDRVIRSGRYWVPHWYKASHWLAYWDVFSRPATKPRYARGAPDTWWYDRERLGKIVQ